MENTSVKPLSNAARTATTNSGDQTNYNSKGLHLIINVSVAPTSGSITPKIQGISNGTYYDLLVGNPITTTGITILKIYPGISPIAGISANDSLPLNWRVVVTHSTSDSFTYSVSANLVA